MIPFWLPEGYVCPPRRIEINSPLGSKKLVDISDAFTLLPFSMLKSLGREVVDPDTHLRFLPELHLESGMVWLRDTHLSPAAQYASDFISEKILRLFSKK